MDQPGRLRRAARRVRIAVLYAASLLPSPLHEAFYRVVLGARLGRGVRLGLFAVLDAPEIDVGPGTVVGRGARIEARRITIQGRVRIGRGVVVRVHRLAMAWRTVLDDRVEVAGDPDDAQSVLAMGMHSWIFPRCFVNVARPVVLGRNAGVGGASFVFTHGYWLSQIRGFPVAYGPVRLRDDVWVPWNCTILPGVTIGSRVVLGAGAVVNRSLPDDALAVGVPARVVRERSRRETTLDDRRRATLGVVAEFLARRGGVAPQEKSGAGVVRCGATPGPAFAVCDTLDAARTALAAAPPPVLALVLAPIDANDAALRAGPLCSVENGLSSPDASLSAAAREFLQFARRVGVRHYPVDEYLASEALMAAFAEEDERPRA
jgi:acetyltransferase-like isoleucine patch superfamily enzyme